MKFSSLIITLLISSTTILFYVSPGWCQLARRGDMRRDTPRFKERDYFLDKKHNHNRHYPRPGISIREIPPGAYYRPYRRHRYYYYGGVWYRPARSGFTVVVPPVGLAVPVLPPYYTTIWVGGVPYYYADGVYYAWRPQEEVYVISEPPQEDKVTENPPQPERLFIYPKEGQSEEKQATDRYECHSWSMGQTGFDPTRPGGNVPEGQYNDKKAEYQRAMKACLEARNYSVQ